MPTLNAFEKTEDSESDVDYVEFHFGDAVYKDPNFPYSWECEERGFGEKIIKATAYDKAGNSHSDEITVLKIF